MQFTFDPLASFTRLVVGAALCACLMAPTSAVATVILPSLPPGSQYQLVFATSGEIAVTSSSISTYNTYATSQAASLAALLPAGVTWHAVVSTGTSPNDAVDNAPSTAGIPVYNTQGIEVSAGSLYSGTLLAPINYTQSGGNPPITLIWTGSDPFGHALNPLGGADPEYGLSNSSTANWAAFAADTPAGIPWPIYVLSSPITVVPEPSTISLFAIALAGTAIMLRRRSLMHRG
jgi:hypothetical protein